MDLSDFEKWISSTTRPDGGQYTKNAIATRKRHLYKVETIVGDINLCIKSEDTMYKALQCIQKSDNHSHAPLQNALRLYWKFKKGTDFPRLKYYKYIKGE